MKKIGKCTKEKFHVNTRGVYRMKICRITNTRFSWILEVDGETIPFQHNWNAEYFKNHYQSLGYMVEEVNNYAFRNNSNK